MGRQLIKQTVEQERNLELQRRQDFQRIFQELESHTQNRGTITKNHEAISDYQKYLSGLLIQNKEEIFNMI